MASIRDQLKMDAIQKLPLKTRLTIFGAIILLLVISYIFQYQIPLNTQIEELEKGIADLQSKQQVNEGKIKQLDMLKYEVKTLEQRLVVLTEQLPPGTEVSGLLRQIQSLVNQSGLILKFWKPEGRRVHESGMYEEIPMSMSLTGGYHNTAAFFDRISKLTRIVNIYNIKIGGAKVGVSGNVDVEINCTAMTFAAVEKKSETPQSAAVAKKVQ